MTADEMAHIRRLTLQVLAARRVEAVFAADSATVMFGRVEVQPSTTWSACRKTRATGLARTGGQALRGHARRAGPPRGRGHGLLELLEQVRARVLSTEQVESSPRGMLSYADGLLADGLTEVLCIDYPDVVAYAQRRPGLRARTPAGARAGRCGTVAEPIVEVIRRGDDDTEFSILAGESVRCSSARRSSTSGPWCPITCR